MTENRSPSSLPNGSDIHLPWHLRLPKPLEKRFRLYLLDSVIRVAPWAFVIVALLTLTALACEFMVNPELLQTSWRARLLMLFAAAGCFILARNEQWRHWLHPATLGLAFTIGLTGNYLGMKVDNPLSYAFYLQTSLAILLISALIRTPFHTSLAASVVLVALMSVSAYNSPTNPPLEAMVLTVLTVSYALISLLGQYIYERLLRHHFLSENVLHQHRDELHSANLVLENQATVDGLTGCINRRGMEARLANQFHHLKQSLPGEEKRITLLLFDIDFFKQYNDTYGHLAGDECLKKIADVPLSMVQSDVDFVARYGGEEFVIVLNDSSVNDGLVFAERMRSRIEQLGLEHSGSRVSQVVTISVGVASTDSGAKNGTELTKQADDALYEAKETGRNQVVYLDATGRLKPLNG